MRRWICLSALLVGSSGTMGTLPSLAQAPAPRLELTEEQRKAEEAFSLADGLYRKGFYDQAVAKFLEFVQQYPTHDNASLALLEAGEAYYAQERYGDAASLYQRVIKEYANSEEMDEAAYRLGLAYYYLGSYPEAIAALQDLLQRAPESQYCASAHYWIGDSHYRSKQYPEAIKSYAESRRLAPQGQFAAWAAYSAGMSHLQLGNGQEALQSFETVVKDYGDSPIAAESELRLAEALDAAGKTAEARAAYEAVIERHDQDLMPGALNGLAWSHFGAEEWAKARAAFERLAKEYPQSPYAAAAGRHVGDCLYHEGKYAEAATAYEKALPSAAAEDAPDILFWLAAAQEKAGDAAAAKATYQKLTTDYPNSAAAAKAAVRVAEASADSNDLDAAEQAYRAAAGSDDPQLRAQGRLGLAWVAYKRGDTAAAVQEYEKLAREDPGSETGATAAFQGAKIALAAEDHTKTGELCALFLQHNADDGDAPQVHYMAGLAHAAAGKTQEAAKAFEAAADGAPKADFTADALSRLAQLYREAGDQAKADAALARLKRDFPESGATAAVQQDAAHELFEAGKYPEARRAYEAALADAKDPELAAVCRLGIGATYFQEQQYDRALAAYREIVAKHPNASAAEAAAYQIGVCLSRLGDHAEAAKALAEFLDAHGDSEYAAGARSELAWAYVKSGQADRAKPIYEELAGGGAAQPEEAAGALFQLGEMAYEAGQHEAALKHYDQLVADHANSDLMDETQYKRGWCLLQLERKDEAVAAFRACLAADPRSDLAADCHYRVGLVLIEKSDTDAAIAELEGFTDKWRDEAVAPFAVLSLGDLYAEKKDWQRLEAALKATPDTGEPAYVAKRSLLLGRALAGLGRSDEAVPHLARAAELARGDVAACARYEMAAAQEAAGKHAEAAEAFLNVAILHGDSAYAAPAMFRAGQAFESAGAKAEAQKAYDGLIEDYPAANEWVEQAKARLQALGQ